jgi:hypothetical protein
MSASTAVAQADGRRLGVMVRTQNEIFAYWSPSLDRPLTLRVTDLTGRPAAESLDGRGYRDVPLEAGAEEQYLTGLQPGHLYVVEIGETEEGAFHPLLSAGPVQTPWLPSPDKSDFPRPYHRS